jgi:ribose-phosphate pyrophosphokinase
MNIIGEVEGRNCVIMDDMVDTAGTLTKAAEVLKERGAKKVVAYCTHPVLSGPAIERIANSPLDELVVTDTIPLSAAGQACSKIRQLTCAPLLAETFKRISKGDSVMSLLSIRLRSFSKCVPAGKPRSAFHSEAPGRGAFPQPGYRGN